MTEKQNIASIENYDKHEQGQPSTLFKADVREDKIADAVMIDFDFSFDENALNHSMKSLVPSHKSDRGFLWLIPVLHAVPSLVVTACMYVSWVAIRNEKSFIPSISATWQNEPESYIYGPVIAFHSFTGYIMIYIRYKQLKDKTDNAMINFHRLNTSSLVLGLTAMMAGVVAGFFPLGTLDTCHYVFAGIYLFIYGIYNITQAVISAKVGSVPGCGRKIIKSRVYSACFQLVLGLSYIGTWGIHWQLPVMYEVSNVFQWTYCLFAVTFSLTFVREFYHLRMNVTIYFSKTTGSRRMDNMMEKADHDMPSKNMSIDKHMFMATHVGDATSTPVQDRRNSMQERRMPPWIQRELFG